jgi:short-subunit dehydrogenase
MNLTGKWSLITGASSGIGKEYALQLSKLGSNTIILARREKRLQELKSEILQKYPDQKVHIIQVDLSKENGAQIIFEKISSLKINIHILINNAGLGSYTPLLETDWEGQKEMILLNIMSLTQLTHYFVQHMAQHGEESYITNVASIAAYISPPNFSTYNGTKSFVRTFSSTLSEELRKSNIHVFCLSPGGVTTEFSEVSGQELSTSANRAMMNPHDVTSMAIKAMFSKKTSLIPGFSNKMMALIARFLSDRLVTKITSNLFGNMVKSKKRNKVIP